MSASPGLMICDDVQHPYYVLVRKSVFLRPHLLMYYRMFAGSSFVPKAQYGPFSKLISILLAGGREGGRAIGLTTFSWNLQFVILVSGWPGVTTTTSAPVKL